MLVPLLLLVAPAGCALLLRRAGLPGWRVIGGVAAGLILGPTLLGRVAPEQFRSLVEGGRAEHAQLVAERIAAERLGADPVAATAAQHETWVRAARAHQLPQRVLTSMLVVLVLLGAGAFRVPRSEHRHALAGALSIGAWSAALPAGLAFFAMRTLWDAGVYESAIAAAAVAMGPWALTGSDRDAADRAELGGARMIQSAGRFATLVAILLAGGAMWHRDGTTGLVRALPLLAAVAGWFCPVPARAAGAARAVVETVFVPALAACAAIRIDLLQDLAFWPALVFLLLSADGRWFGAFLGAVAVGGRGGLRTMRLVMGSMAAGPTQLAVAALGASVWLLEPRFTTALLVGAVLIEASAPMRRRMTVRLAETETETEQ